ncbi:sensor histidine kinase [Brevundimonas sp.]|uniref:sensor histidine kinase n=1 Tax=Brevundimonas sp. TaxID=1871086 RepID=UPI0037BEA865
MRTADLAETGLPWPFARLARTWWGGVLFGAASVAIAVGFRALLEPLGHFYYLPMMAAVMVSALLAHRSAAVTAVALSLISSLVIIPRAGALDAAANAILFVVVASSMAEVCHRLIAALDRSRALSRDLMARSALLDTILTSIPVVTLDQDSRILRITPAAADLLGVAPSDALTRPFQSFAPDFDMTIFAAVAEGGVAPPPAAGHWSVRGPGGETVPMTIHANRLGEEAAPERLVLSLADQRQALAARERTRELSGQLSSVWRLNSMGEMAATLAHELNQPLTAATVYLHAGQTDIARAGPIGDSASRALDLAKTQLLRAGDIIRRMRELIATGAQSLADERVSSMIDDLTPIFHLIGKDTGVTIRIDVHDMEDRVLADRIQIQQAVANLVRNAVDAVTGHPDGLVSVTGRSLPGRAYEIRVEDNGPGIAEDQMDRIFQPMTTTKAGGMGLGLSVTRSIVESHNAALTVGRSPLGGAAFSFSLSRVSELEAA